jgi:P-type E1-E2 ATPase
MQDCGVAIPESMDYPGGVTTLHVARDTQYLGSLHLADALRPSSRESVANFRAAGIRVMMLTGDSHAAAEAIGKEAGLDSRDILSGLVPADKEQEILRLQREGHKVAMVGDGINDAPALARADVGIAIGGGTHIAIDTADAVLMRSDLQDAWTAREISRKTIANIKMNLFWAFFYNILAIPFAAGALIPLWGIARPPAAGALAMACSSVCVVSNALRLKKA